MRPNIKKAIISIILASIAGMLNPILAQEGKRGWEDKMKSEKIAFLTSEMNISSEEAQVFWPVYNKVAAEKKELMDAMFQAFQDLFSAIDNKEGDKKIEVLLDAYLKAQTAVNSFDEKSVKEYKKVLTTEKIAMLFIAEENFRKVQIRKLSPAQPRTDMPGAFQPQPRP